MMIIIVTIHNDKHHCTHGIVNNAESYPTLLGCLGGVIRLMTIIRIVETAARITAKCRKCTEDSMGHRVSTSPLPHCGPFRIHSNAKRVSPIATHIMVDQKAPCEISLQYNNYIFITVVIHVHRATIYLVAFLNCIIAIVNINDYMYVQSSQIL